MLDVEQLRVKAGNANLRILETALRTNDTLLPEFEWNFAVIYERKHDEHGYKTCGYVGCAMGMARCIGIIKGEHGYFYEIERACHLTEEDAQWIFDNPSGYDKEYARDVTATMVADRIAEFIKSREDA